MNVSRYRGNEIPQHVLDGLNEADVHMTVISWLLGEALKHQANNVEPFDGVDSPHIDYGGETYWPVGYRVIDGELEEGDDLAPGPYVELWCIQDPDDPSTIATGWYPLG